MKRFKPLRIIALFLVISVPCKAVIYGEDSVTDIMNVQDQRVLKQSKAVAGVFKFFSSPENALNRFGQGRKLSHKMVCEIERFSFQPIESVATAFLIDSKHVMTVGHAVTSSQACREGVFFSFDYVWEGEKVKDLTKKDIYFCEGIKEYSYSQIDYAIIELDREVKGIEPLELDFQHQTYNEEEIYTIGHPLQLPKKLATGKMRQAPEEEENYYTAELDSFRGNSGSPVFSKDTGKVIGILKDGEVDFELNEEDFCYMFKVCPEDGRTCRGESITRLDKLPKKFLGSLQTNN